MQNKDPGFSIFGLISQGYLCGLEAWECALFQNNALTIGIAGDLGALVGLFGHYFRDEVCNPD